jgi:hypothetical protein
LVPGEQISGTRKVSEALWEPKMAISLFFLGRSAMKKLVGAFLCMALAVSFGCNNKSAPGGPGAGGTGKAARDDSFTFTVPSTTTTLKQGEAKDITIAVKRGKDFKQDVTLAATSEGKGVTVTPNPAELKASDSVTDLKFHVEAAKDAAIGEHKVTVKATPQTGSATEKTFNVKVTGP